MYSKVAVGLLIIAVYTDVVLLCPNNCSCYKLQDGRHHIDCNNQGFTTIPRNFPNDSSIISVDLNYITTIEEGAFQDMQLLTIVAIRLSELSTIETGAFRALPNLINIDLYTNRITILEPGTFKDLPRLASIELGSNQLVTIQKGTFVDLPALSSLYVYSFTDLFCKSQDICPGNEIATLQKGVFQGLSQLQELYLSGNSLTLVNNSTFETLTSLIYLLLTDNLITTIQQGSFQNLSSLVTLNMIGNKLTFVKNDTFEHNIKLQYLILLSSLQESDLDNCTFTDNSCHPDYCLNGGSCSRDSNGDLICSCVVGWTGAKCNDSSCHPGICSNGGSCSQNLNSSDSVCSCVGGWTGAACTGKRENVKEIDNGIYTAFRRKYSSL
ncbi:unnamed protein product [Mytilus edulis]|uniref:EGF-like domain-containing protein n=1 Tax=Mytilus edulis TaxID=6550 RepID=A0A8S3PQK5_MYTED|nr:unnamed protein product [Mytilus edulis]